VILTWYPAQLKNPKGIHDVAEWYMSTIIRTGYIHSIFEKKTEIAIESYAKIYEKNRK
jgi:hypothetical protein